MTGRDASAGRRYLLLAVGVVIVAVGGYAGYVVYPRFELPAAAGAGLLALAGAAGFAAFFSPCSFPLLATLLARHTGADQPTATRVRRALLFATSLSVGAVAFVLAVGALFALGGQQLAGAVTFTSVIGRVLRVIVGVGLIALGLIQADRIHANLRGLEPTVHGLLRSQAGLRRRRPLAGTAVFGFGYLAAGFG
jgi:cytochrome c biogenesis protein CcdA